MTGEPTDLTATPPPPAASAPTAPAPITAPPPIRQRRLTRKSDDRGQILLRTELVVPCLVIALGVAAILGALTRTNRTPPAG